MDISQQASNNIKYDFVLHHPFQKKKIKLIQFLLYINVHLEMRMTGQIGGLRLVGLHLDLVAGREEGVEPHNQLGVALEQHGHAGDDARRVNRLGFKLLKLEGKRALKWRFHHDRRIFLSHSDCSLNTR